MTDPVSFEDLARALAREGASTSCGAEADRLDARAARDPPLRAEALRRAARGLRIAARVLAPLAPAARAAPFRPGGLRGAIAAGHLALATGRAADAELIGTGAAEAAPDSPAGLRLVSQALFAEGRFALAVRASRGALAVDPDDRYTRALHLEALWFAGERVAARCALATLRATGTEPLAAALEDAIRAGALDEAGARGGVR
jgi:hypothetical protein